jgi:two-component system phosphate regulon response regulator PhoB
MSIQRILVVDDEKDLVNLLRYNLEKGGFTVSCDTDGASVLALAEADPPDLIILDLMLPNRSGYEICRDLKASDVTREIPIIMLTARSSEANRITGFECGVDDYVVKPFSPKELVLRVRALLVRTAAYRERKQLSQASDKGSSMSSVSSLNLNPSTVWQLGPLRIDIDGFRVFVAEQEVFLTQTEFAILRTLAEQPNRARTREQILSAVWEEEAETVLDRSVDAQVKRLRAKLGPAREMVETVRGLGYRLSVKAEAQTSFPLWQEPSKASLALSSIGIKEGET